MDQWPLNSDERQKYMQWVIQNKIPLSNDYNMESFWKTAQLDPRVSSEVNPNDGMVHFTDKFKLPNHRTFSTDSDYYNAATMPNTPSWNGGLLGQSGQSWALRRPDGGVVDYEAPWFKRGILE